jgi:hypothetical protein
MPEIGDHRNVPNFPSILSHVVIRQLLLDPNCIPHSSRDGVAQVWILSSVKRRGNSAKGLDERIHGENRDKEFH